jgi:hypothetical protein
VERFCDKLTLRITGKALYKKEASIPDLDGTYSGHSSSQNYFFKDPTLWLSLGSGITSIVVVAVGDKNYKRFTSRLEKSAIYEAFFMGALSNNYPTFFWASQRLKKSYHPLRDHRDTLHIISGSIGGFAGAMLLTFVGRSIYHAVEVKVGINNSTNNVALFIPSQYINPVDWANGKPGFGLGMSMRFYLFIDPSRNVSPFGPDGQVKYKSREGEPLPGFVSYNNPLFRYLEGRAAP